ncbi:hypothetical protein EMIHUDRAFT_215120 [Emiliania huxleyi CCMP1516]|uniref:Uncharacterized protein n=2 Tax=Emiliania huxleyi TaxID=2903 RepID=A0A0D3IHY6_EMIH1|nr:hypothetical protein EMIHUDRAFT_215120 [Emiliania huxleyi CCMP1516]EOD10871.1 hypothetical protein EMIHUDRAFT_215120 [Emiliania huxleyi CCMP1516]|eukprot:XP_005763300.1 hypothetical protein EMIHUDRAFT_215120 [Emiliania huxleyi CCMP1516]
MPLCCAADSPSSEPARGGEPRPVSLVRWRRQLASADSGPTADPAPGVWGEPRSSSLVVYGGGGGGSPFPPAAIPIPPRSREVARIHLTPFLLNGYPCLLCPCVVCFKFLQPKVIEGKKIDCALGISTSRTSRGGAPQLFTTNLVVPAVVGEGLNSLDTMRWALASSLLISCSSTPEAEPTLLEAFSEFASCEGAEAAALLAARRDFFHAYPTETAVRALPQHVARNEQG